MTRITPRREDEAAATAPRSFGILIAAALAAVALLPLWRGGEPRYWAGALSVLVITVAIVRPAILAPANRVWLAIGAVLHRIVNPIVLAVVFFAAVTPFALIARLVHPALSRRMRPDANRSTYWIPRQSDVSSMDRQF
jgi:hypothetical protein